MSTPSTLTTDGGAAFNTAALQLRDALWEHLRGYRPGGAVAVTALVNVLLLVYVHIRKTAKPDDPWPCESMRLLADQLRACADTPTVEAMETLLADMSAANTKH
jgi:hypothetical protein